MMVCPIFVIQVTILLFYEFKQKTAFIWNAWKTHKPVCFRKPKTEKTNNRKRHVFLRFIFGVGLFSMSFMTCFPAPTTEFYRCVFC